MVEIRRLSASEAREYVSELAGVLVDCVEGGQPAWMLESVFSWLRFSMAKWWGPFKF